MCHSIPFLTLEDISSAHPFFFSSFASNIHTTHTILPSVSSHTSFILTDAFWYFTSSDMGFLYCQIIQASSPDIIKKSCKIFRFLIDYSSTRLKPHFLPHPLSRVVCISSTNLCYWSNYFLGLYHLFCNVIGSGGKWPGSNTSITLIIMMQQRTNFSHRRLVESPLTLWASSLLLHASSRLPNYPRTVCCHGRHEGK